MLCSEKKQEETLLFELQNKSREENIIWIFLNYYCYYCFPAEERSWKI